MVPVTEKEYKVGSNDGVISVVFKNIFFQWQIYNNMGEIVLADQSTLAEKISFVFSIHFGFYN